MITLLSEKFTEMYYPERDICMDKATCPFKARVWFKVNNPMKPHKFGIKLYQICEASSGYCVGFHVYSGKGDNVLSEYAELAGCYTENMLTTKTVTGLMAKCGVLNKGHHVNLDNYYNSPELADELCSNDTYMCGTLRTNRREVPKVFQQVKGLKQGDCIFRRNENTLILKYHDKRDINMISTFHPAKMVITDKVDAAGEPILKPTVIVDYVQKMGGVDVSDQVIGYYNVLHKCVKWSMKLFLHLFSRMLVNSFILSKKGGVQFKNKKRAHINFRQSLVSALLEESAEVPLPGRKGRQVEPEGRLTERHFPSYIVAKEGAKRRRPLRDCKACNVNPKQRQGFKRVQTSFMCADCNVALCVPDCFRAWHTYQNYRAVLQQTDSDGD